MEDSPVLHINPAFELEEVNNCLLLHDDIHMFIFEDFEKRILSLFDGKRDLNDISHLLQSQYDGYDERDLLDFVNSLKQINILIK